MNAMNSSRKWWGGVAGGLLLAIAGPAGMAVGHSSHPVGQASHPEAGALFGTVTAADTGDPVDDVCVTAERRWGHKRGTTGWAYDRVRTSNGGHYFFNYLQPGAYRLLIDPGCQASPSEGIYAPEWFDDQIERDRATVVKIVADQTTAQDVVIERAGAIAVSVTDTTGAEVDTCVSLHPADVERFDVSSPDRVYAGWADQLRWGRVIDGERTITGLHPGDYRLLVGCLRGEAAERPAPFGYIPRWSPIVTVEELTTSSLEVTLTRAGVIAGTIEDQAGTPFSSSLQIHRSADEVADYAYASDGGFETERLAPGPYRTHVGYGFFDCWSVCFVPRWYGDYVDEWYDDHAKTFAAADPIEVIAGEATHIELSVLRRTPDFAVTDLTVSDPGIETALGAVPSAWLRKEISVTVDELNDHPYGEYNTVCVWAESRSSSTGSSARTLIATEGLRSEELTEPRTFTYSWTPVGAVGDLRIRAKLRYSDENPVNDQRVVETAVGVKGAGGIVLGNLAGLYPPILFGSSSGC